MYKRKSPQITMFETPENFMMLSALDPNNRWVKMSKLIPWDLIEEKYAKSFKETPFSRPAKPARMAIGTQIIKEKYVLSDDETVEMITENPYLQFFIGLESFSNKAPMEASVLTLFRKRITPEMLAEINDYIIGRKKKEDDDENDPPGGSTNGKESTDAEEKTNKGTLILDATCVPSDIRFPTDVSLLNQGREYLESIIDEQHEKGLTNGHKPRTYRQVAHKDYMRFARNRRLTRKLIHKVIRKQLGYICRNLKAIEECSLTHLSQKSLERLAVVSKLYEQQKQMYESKTHQVEDRIVSLSQPWVRPIVRGKSTAQTEFGAKIAVSVLDGYVRIEHLCWNAYNESNTLEETVERYKAQTGLYPQRILADKIYRTRDNLKYCTKHGISMSGPKLGRPPKDKALYEHQCRDERREAGERNEIEGKFGTGKRCYGLDRLTARLKDTSETQIHMIVLTMNLWKKLKSSFSHFFKQMYMLRFWSTYTSDIDYVQIAV
jgi:transposase, IS5 family